jgi:acetyl-CoA carboxylase biotin carboxyl carrier protein
MSTKSTSSLNPELVRELAALLDETGLSEIEYDSGQWRVRVARNVSHAVAPSPVDGAHSREAMPTTAAGTPHRGPAAKSETEQTAEHPGILASPMVGVVYTKAEPDTPAFVSVGDTVKVGDTVLLIEAMKVFNTIKAHRSGRIARVFVDNGVPVEYGEPLLLID